MIKIKTFFIQEADKHSKIKELFSIIKVENDKIVLPMEITENRISKIVKKINKKCKKNNVINVVLSKKLNKNPKFINEIEQSGLNIFNGKWLFGYMTYEVINYIMKKTKQEKPKMEISILANNINEQVVDTINQLAKEFKRVNIVTNHINELKYLEERLYNEYGIMITLTNNKRKSLAKASLILNFDFVKDVLNKYNIYENAIIINIEEDMKIYKKRFNGINVNGYEIFSKRAEDFFEIERIKKFYLKDLVETELYRKDSYKNIRKDIIKGLYEIKDLYGNNGVLWR